jgi:putative ABC transport system permease protein
MPLPPTLRALTHARGLSATVIGTIAVGTAALITAFTVIDAAVFRQPPFPQADRLAMLYLQRNPEGEAPRQERWSFARFERLREAQQSFEHIASYSPTTLTLSGDAGAELAYGERVSASYFQVLRATAARGRVFGASEDDPAHPAPVAVLGHGLWMRRWGGDTSIIGRTIRLNSVPLTVIGVMLPGFGGLSGRAELWFPRTMSPQITYAEYLTTNQNFISAVGRLRPGVGLGAVRSELAVLGAAINRALPSDPRYPQERVTATATPLNEARINRTTRRSLFVLFGAVALLHLLACANVTNLLLGRAAGRQREFAVRVALGVRPRRLFGQILGEGLLLSAIGAALGVLVAWWASGLLAPPANVWAPRNFYGSVAPFDTPGFGAEELLFGVALMIATSIVVAIPPAMSTFRVDVSSGIKAGSRAVLAGGISLRRPGSRGVIVAIEAAFAMMLVVAAGLLIDSYQRMRQVDIGVDADNVLTFWVIPSEVRVPPADAPAFVSRLLAAVQRVPGVRSASVDGGAPMAGTASSVLYIDGRPEPGPGQAPPVLRHYIGPDHFATLGIPLLRGRAFTSGDVAGAPRVAIISETAARRFWPDADPIGERVWFGSGSNFNSRDSSAVIVGIVGDVVYAPLDQQPNFASFYTPYPQFTYASRMVFVRTEGPPLSVLAGVRNAVAMVDPELAMQETQPLADIVRGSWARNRFDALLFGGFGLAAILLAASGIYAVLAYAVATRTREFGIRIALGAGTLRVLRNVLLEGVAFPIAGLAVGLAASLAISRVLQSTLYDVSPQDPRVFAGTAVLLLLVAIAACLVPAWRATRADPMEALRAE